MRFFYSEKCIHMILWIANPLCDDTACWHAALRVLRAEAAKVPVSTLFAWNPQHRHTPGGHDVTGDLATTPEELHQAFSLISKVLRFARAGHGNLPIADQAI